MFVMAMVEWHWTKGLFQANFGYPCIGLNYVNNIVDNQHFQVLETDKFIKFFET